MTDQHPGPLDPDEVTCRKCLAAPGVPCRQPNGDRSRSVHLQRRRDAEAGIRDAAQSAPAPQRPTRRGGKPDGASTFTSETASAAARKSAQERRRRRAEAAAAMEAAREEAERNAIEDEARRLADDAVKWERDRAMVRRQTLDVVASANTRLGEALTNLRRPRGFDEHGKPLTIPVERVKVTEDKPNADGLVIRRTSRVVDEAGDPVIDEELDLVGWYNVDHVVQLAKAAAALHNSLRLEEGKATSIVDTGPVGPADVLGEAGVEELLRYAGSKLPPEDKS